jgi:hypothetical protein
MQYDCIGTPMRPPPQSVETQTPTREDVLAAYAEMGRLCPRESPKNWSAEQLAACRAAIARSEAAHQQHSAWWNMWGADESPLWPWQPITLFGLAALIVWSNLYERQKMPAPDNPTRAAGIRCRYVEERA